MERDIERGRDGERDRERDGRMARHTNKMQVQGIQARYPSRAHTQHDG